MAIIQANNGEVLGKLDDIWIVNDKLTCIKNTHTHWHELLSLSSQCKDRTSPIGSFLFLDWITSFRILFSKHPKYIVRNCTFFRKLPILPRKIKVISILQDFYGDEYFKEKQETVIKQSYKVVCVSKFMYDKAYHLLNTVENKNKLILINNGVDEIFWNSNASKNLNKVPKTLCFIGENNQFKNIPLLKKIIENTVFNYVLIMRDPKNEFEYVHPRVKIFKNISTDNVKKVIRDNADAALCTSCERETFHLSGIQMMLMNKPIATTYVGIYKNFSELDYELHPFGIYINEENAVEQVNKMMESIDKKCFRPRDFIIEFDDGKITRNSNNNSWKSLLEIL